MSYSLRIAETRRRSPWAGVGASSGCPAGREQGLGLDAHAAADIVGYDDGGSSSNSIVNETLAGWAVENDDPLSAARLRGRLEASAVASFWLRASRQPIARVGRSIDRMRSQLYGTRRATLADQRRRGRVGIRVR